MDCARSIRLHPTPVYRVLCDVKPQCSTGFLPEEKAYITLAGHLKVNSALLQTEEYRVHPASPVDDL